MMMNGFGSCALQFLILTASRTSEVLKASWLEFNDDLSIWIIPPERMKFGKEHRVPLTEQASNILKRLAEFRSSDLVFPSQKSGHPLSNMTMANVLKRMGEQITAHGFRSSFRDWAETRNAYSHRAMEYCLGHAVKNKTEAAYQRNDLLEQRKVILNHWNNYNINDKKRNFYACASVFNSIIKIYSFLRLS